MRVIPIPGPCTLDEWLQTLSQPELHEVLYHVTEAMRARKVAEFEAAPCTCDRYTCWRCQVLARLQRGTFTPDPNLHPMVAR